MKSACQVESSPLCDTVKLPGHPVKAKVPQSARESWLHQGESPGYGNNPLLGTMGSQALDPSVQFTD